MYYIPGRGDPKRTKVGDLLTASASIYIWKIGTSSETKLT